MKIPKPQHRCGSWRVQITVKGQRYNRTFPTEEAALYWAASVKTHSSHADAVIRAGTVGEAIEEYILLKEAVLSPSTVAGYNPTYNVIQSNVFLHFLRTFGEKMVYYFIFLSCETKRSMALFSAGEPLSCPICSSRMMMSSRSSL